MHVKGYAVLIFVAAGGEPCHPEHVPQAAGLVLGNNAIAVLVVPFDAIGQLEPFVARHPANV